MTCLGFFESPFTYDCRELRWQGPNKVWPEWKTPTQLFNLNTPTGEMTMSQTAFPELDILRQTCGTWDFFIIKLANQHFEMEITLFGTPKLLTEYSDFSWHQKK